MTRTTSLSRLAALALSTTTVIHAQTVVSTTPPSNTATSTPSGTTSDTAASTSVDVALSLWSEANSLISTYYPSTSATAINQLTFPATVVIGSSTYSVHPESTTSSASTSVLAEQTASAANHGPSKSHPTDKKLGVVLGVVIGAIVLAVLTFVFCLLWRRKKATGAYFLRRPTPSIADSEIGAWRGGQHVEAAPASSSRTWVESYNRLPTQAPPMAMHPAYMGHDSNSSRPISEENPFYTPQERADAQLGHYEHGSAVEQYRELDAGEMSQRRSSSSARRGSRPSTPFSPAMMMMGSGPRQPPREHNPFSSPDDDEADDMISPIIPSRSPERRHSPAVHYPSWNEVSEFDFTGDGRGRSVRGQSSSDEGGDGWHPTRESMLGRSELP